MRQRLVVSWTLIAAGFAAIGAGWVGVQSTVNVAVQLAYLTSGALFGIGLIVTGSGMQTHDELRAVRSLLEELQDRFDDLEEGVEELRTARVDLPRRVRRGAA